MKNTPSNELGLPEHLYAKIAAMAAAEGRSVKEQAIFLLDAMVNAALAEYNATNLTPTPANHE